MMTSIMNMKMRIGTKKRKRNETVERYSDDITSGYFDAFLSYQGRWKKWNLNIGVGGNAFRSMNEFSTIFDNDYFNVEQLDNESWRSSKRRDEQQSFYGMLNVNFDNWLYLDFATRREWNDEKLTYRDKQSFNYSVGGNHLRAAAIILKFYFPDRVIVDIRELLR